MSYSWLKEAEQQFTQSRAENRLAHATLVSGPVGLGKLDFARRASQSLLCLQNKSLDDLATATCSCRSCQLLTSGAHPDFRLLTYEENEKTKKMRTELVVDQVRRLTESMQLTNSLSPCKVALVHPAEAMNRSTANALLKTLEEPPGDAALFLVSHDPARLTPTIRSRCQSIHVRIPDRTVAHEWLQQQGVLDGELASRALQASAGSPLVALQMIEDGRAEQYLAVYTLLDRVQQDENSIAEVIDACSAFEPHDLWTWLSLITAHRVRGGFGAHRREDAEASKAVAVAAHPGSMGRITALSRLQSQADRNRLLMSTQLRKDLLLRDWLIQWARTARS